MTSRRIWQWLQGLPDEYEHHEHHIRQAEHQAHLWNGQSDQTATASKKAPKRRFDVAELSRKGVEVIDLTGEESDADIDESAQGRKAQKPRAQLRLVQEKKVDRLRSRRGKVVR
ncbi:hypothetical protein PMZ80_005789 [Knufia obscura]|uniref:Uncharacterized protein n=2 Tax=Knufia TaxID=430999 RepID=A0AAN8I9K1_9EURO|nr:hypothetical protein PMZ80_005789 [Knufia obscura]KAK5954455.1 hypothetical protein OHC33_004177 [Knufia fluminis]